MKSLFILECGIKDYFTRAVPIVVRSETRSPSGRGASPSQGAMTSGGNISTSANPASRNARTRSSGRCLESHGSPAAAACASIGVSEGVDEGCGVFDDAAQLKPSAANTACEVTGAKENTISLLFGKLTT